MSEMNGQYNNGLPKGWEWVTFNDVCTKIGDIDHKMPKTVENGYPYVSTKDLTNELKVSFDNVKYISKEDFHLLSKKIKPERGDIIFPRYGTIGKNILVDFDKEFLVSYSCAIVKPNPAFVKSKFFYFYSLSPHVAKEIKKYVVETTQANVGIASIKRFVFPLPPLPVQEQIVSKIEELFSELDKSIEQLKTSQQQLKVYRQSVFNRILTASDLKSIESIIEKLDQGWSPKCENEQSINDEWGVIKTSAVQQGYFLEQENKRLPKELKPREQHELKAGDILITRAGPRIRVGVCCLVKHVRTKLLNCDKVYRIKVNGKIVRPEYFEFVLNTPKYLYEIEKMKTGINDSGVNLTQKGFLKIEIPIPTLEKQEQLIKEAHQQTSIADKLEETITSSLQQAEALRQSILKKAFAGELV
jgi:type I restriction enzyme, S subunit